MSNKNLYVLAIESSCDDTSVSILRNDRVLSNITATQDVHKRFGGVVPELASRSHQKNMIPVMDTALKEAGVQKEQLDLVAYTKGPGLPGSLIVGNAFAKSISMALSIPLVEVNHMQAHILAHFIHGVHEKQPTFPFLCLTVSGGHTQLVLVNDYFDMRIVGATLDDAAGEAFDKIAKILGLDYPGGPLVDKLAANGDKNRFTFPKPKVPELSFSFSGLKTAVLYFIRDQEKKNTHFIEENIHDIAASVQHTIVEILIEKLTAAAIKHKVNQIGLAGGVSANKGLRKALVEKGKDQSWDIFVPPIQYCTDNAAMIGIAGYLKSKSGIFTNLSSVSTARLEFDRITR